MALSRPHTHEHAEPRAGPSGPRMPARCAEAEPRAPDPDQLLWQALRTADPQHGISVVDLVKTTGMSRATVDRRLQAHAAAGRAEQTSTGRWRATTTEPG
jgi:hypothetical protein